MRSAPPITTAPYRFIAVPTALPTGVHAERSADCFNRSRCPIFGAPGSEDCPSERVAGHTNPVAAVE